MIRIGVNPGEAFLDRMISMVEGAKRQKTPNEIALNILLAGFTIVCLLATVTLMPYSIYAANSVNADLVAASQPATALPVTTTILGAVGVPDSDDDWGAFVGDWDCGNGSDDPGERDRDVGPRGGGGGGCGRAAVG